MKKLGLASMIISLLSGCAANGFYEGVSSNTPDNIDEFTDKKFLGVPALLAFEGSSVKINNEWRATVAHNAPLLIGQDVFYHPRCDFALIRVKDEGNIPTLNYVYENDTVFHTGYPIFAGYSSHEGKYLGEVQDNKDGCKYSATNGTVIGGMSGGGVFNEKGEAIGVNVGVMLSSVKWKDKSEVSPAVFMSFPAMNDFITEVTGINFYPGFDQSNKLTESELLAIRKEVQDRKLDFSKK